MQIKRKDNDPEKAANFIKNKMLVATSGFTPAGYPKAVPLVLAKRVKQIRY